MRKGSASALRRLLMLPVAFALAVALVIPTAALAASEGESGYNQKPNTPTTPTTTPTPTTPAQTPTTGTSPSKESSTPAKSTAPETTPSTPTSTTEPTSSTKKATTLPRTGFDLRWTIGAGALLMAMGFSLVTAQRRQRRNSGR